MNGKKIMTACAVALAAVTMTLAGAVPALANTATAYGTGNIEVDNSESQVTSFKAYRIFKANVNADGTMSNFAWPSNAVRNAVVGIIQDFDSDYSSLNAQDAADFISAAYKNAGGELTTDKTTILKNAELLNRIAARVDDLTVTATLTAGKTASLSEGYWLIVTDGTSVGVDEDGTAPIFAISGGGNVVMTEKTTVPKVDKKVLNDADGASWTYGTESERGQSVTHMITGTVSSNIKTYDLYYYAFEDTMSNGIDYDLGSYRVTLDGTDVTKYFTESLTHKDGGADTLKIACANLLAIKETKVTGDSTVVLTYKARLNAGCVVGAAGNPNDVKIVYSSNPNTSEKSETHTVRDYLYTFGLHVEKKDRDTNVPLEGAKFTIQATGADDAASKGLYVQSDGSLGTDPYEFVTGKDGVFEITGLDAGTYTLHETQCPEMYQVVNEDTLFTIGAQYNADGTIKTLSNTVSGNADAAAGTDSTDDNTVNGDPGTAAVVSTCQVSVTVGNIEKIKMPLSGQEGTSMLMWGGAGVLTVSVLGVVLASIKKKKAAKA